MTNNGRKRNQATRPFCYWKNKSLVGSEMDLINRSVCSFLYTICLLHFSTDFPGNGSRTAAAGKGKRRRENSQLVLPVILTSRMTTLWPCEIPVPAQREAENSIESVAVKFHWKDLPRLELQNRFFRIPPSIPSLANRSAIKKINLSIYPLSLSSAKFPLFLVFVSISSIFSYNFSLIYHGCRLTCTF